VKRQKSIMETVRKRWASNRPYEDTSTMSLQHKLKVGALSPKATALVRAELERRGQPENSN